MTPEDRFQRLETSLVAVVESQARTNQSIGSLVESISHYGDAADVRAKRMEENQDGLNQSIRILNESIQGYVDAADARTRRIEENLEGLIRAITAEHTNGKAH